MAWLITKYFLTAGLIVVVSEVAKRTEKFGAAATRKNRKLCQLHLLVRPTHASHVHAVSFAAAAFRVLGRTSYRNPLGCHLARGAGVGITPFRDNAVLGRG